MEGGGGGGLGRGRRAQGGGQSQISDPDCYLRGVPSHVPLNLGGREGRAGAGATESRVADLGRFPSHRCEPRRGPLPPVAGFSRVVGPFSESLIDHFPSRSSTVFRVADLEHH